MVRYCDDGRIEIDNNAAERALRAIAVGRRNYLFAGSDAGGERAAAIYSLVASAKLNAWTRKHTCAMCWSAIAIIPSSISRNYFVEGPQQTCLAQSSSPA